MTDVHFKLFPYETALLNSRILNLNQLEDYWWIELPHSKAKFLSLYDISELKQDSDSVKLDYTEKASRDGIKPWIKADSSLFCKEPGQHIYKFSFTVSCVDDVVCLYLIYHIQTDKPDKSSYVYMEREEKVNE